jgi:putative flippase GtrA
MGNVRRLWFEVWRYGLASAIALAVDTSLLRGLVKWLGWHYLPASAVGFTAGATVAYALSVRFVFRGGKLHNRYLELATFVALGLAGLVVNSVVLFLAIGRAGMGLITAKLLAAGCTFATNFTLRRQLLFSSPKASSWERLLSSREPVPPG